jgi:hypothetical protein
MSLCENFIKVERGVAFWAEIIALAKAENERISAEEVNYVAGVQLDPGNGWQEPVIVKLELFEGNTEELQMQIKTASENLEFSEGGVCVDFIYEIY